MSPYSFLSDLSYLYLAFSLSFLTYHFVNGRFKDPAAINVEAMFAAGLNVEMERFLSANPGEEFVAYKHTRPKHIT